MVEYGCGGTVRGVARRLVKPNASRTELIIEEGTVELLESIGKKRIRVCALVGTQREGKSTLLNLLFASLRQPANSSIENFEPKSNTKDDRLCGDEAQALKSFRTGHTLDPETAGLWIRLVDDPRNDDSLIMFIDSEGLEAPGVPNFYNWTLCALTLLLCDVFLYQSKSSIDQRHVERLEVVLRVAQQLKKNPNNAEFSTMGSNFKKQGLRNRQFFLWLLRDAHLDMKDSPKQEMKDKLSHSTYDSLVAIFGQDIDCFPLPSPVVRNLDLRNLDKMQLNQMDPSFQKEFELLTENIRAMLSTSGLSEKCGLDIAALVRTYCKAITGRVGTLQAISSLPTQSQLLATIASERAIGAGIDAYNEAMENVLEKIILQPSLSSFESVLNEFGRMHFEAEKEAERIFFAVALGDSEQNENRQALQIMKKSISFWQPAFSKSQEGLIEERKTLSAEGNDEGNRRESPCLIRYMKRLFSKLERRNLEELNSIQKVLEAVKANRCKSFEEFDAKVDPLLNKIDRLQTYSTEFFPLTSHSTERIRKLIKEQRESVFIEITASRITTSLSESQGEIITRVDHLESHLKNSVIEASEKHTKNFGELETLISERITVQERTAEHKINELRELVTKYMEKEWASRDRKHSAALQLLETKIEKNAKDVSLKYDDVQEKIEAQNLKARSSNQDMQEYVETGLKILRSELDQTMSSINENHETRLSHELREFDVRTDAKTTNLAQGLDRIDQKVTEMTRKISTLEARLCAMEGKSLEKCLSRLEDQVFGIQSHLEQFNEVFCRKMSNVTQKHEDLSKRVESFVNTATEAIEEVEGKLKLTDQSAKELSVEFSVAKTGMDAFITEVFSERAVALENKLLSKISRGNEEVANAVNAIGHESLAKFAAMRDDLLKVRQSVQNQELDFTKKYMDAKKKLKDVNESKEKLFETQHAAHVAIADIKTRLDTFVAKNEKNITGLWDALSTMARSITEMHESVHIQTS